MKVYGYLAILVLVIGLGWKIFALGGENVRLLTVEATHKATIEQLRKDSKSYERLQERNLKLSRRIAHATTVLSTIQDPTGCFRTPIPTLAAIELRNVYLSITGGP